MTTADCTLSWVANVTATHNSGQFSVYSEPLAYYEADAYCVQTGGHLARISNWEESLDVHDLAAPVGACWIGLNEMDAREDRGESEWQWTDGTDVNEGRGHAQGGRGFPENPTWAYWGPRRGRFRDCGTFLDPGGRGWWNLATPSEERCFVCRVPEADACPPAPPPPMPPPDVGVLAAVIGGSVAGVVAILGLVCYLRSKRGTGKVTGSGLQMKTTPKITEFKPTITLSPRGDMQAVV